MPRTLPPLLPLLLLSLCIQAGLTTAVVGQVAGETPAGAEAAPLAAMGSNGTNPQGNELLRSALGRLRSYRSIRATLRQQINLFGHTLVGSGEYHQMVRGRDLLLRMDMKIQLEDRASVYQQISDGRFLWRFSHRPSIDELGSFQQEMNRVDLDVVKSATPTELTAPQIDLAFGGLPHLLLQLQECFELDSVLPGTLHGVPVWMTSGEWRPAALARLLPENEGPLDDRALIGLPEQIPHSVTIHFGKDDLFPYRFEFWRRTSTKSNDGIVVSANARRTVVLELFEVQLNLPIDPAKFVRSSLEIPVVDSTSEYLREHGLSLGSP